MARAVIPRFDDNNDTGYSDIFSPSNRQASPPSQPGVRAAASDSSITQYDGNSVESGPQFAAVIRPPAGERAGAHRSKSSTVSSLGGKKPLSESLRRAMEDDDHDSDQNLWSRDTSRRDSGSIQMSAGSTGFSGGGRASGGLGGAEEGFRRRRWQEGLVEETEGGGQKSEDSGHEFRVVRSSGSDSVAEAVSPKAWDGEATGFGGFPATVATPWRGLGGSGDHSPSNSKPRHVADAVGDLSVNPQESMLAQFRKQSPTGRDPAVPIIGSKLLAAMHAGDEDKERGGTTDSRYRSGNRAGPRDGGGWETGGSSSDMGGMGGGDTPSVGGGFGGSNESQISEISEGSEPMGGRVVRKPKSAIPAVAVVMPEFKKSSQGSYTQIFAQKTDEATKKKAKKSTNPQGSDLRPSPSKDAGSLLLASSIRRALKEELEDESASPEATAYLRDGGGREEGGGGAGVIGLVESVGGVSEDEVEDEEERGEEAGGGKVEGGGVGGFGEHKGGGYSHPFATRIAYRRGVGGAEKVTPVPPMPEAQATMAASLPRPAVNMSSNESSPGSSKQLSSAGGSVGGERRRVPGSVSEGVGGKAGSGRGGGGGSIPVFEDMDKNNGKGSGGGGGFTEAFDHIQKSKGERVPLPSMRESNLEESLPQPKVREARGIRKLLQNFKRSFTLN